MYSIPLDLPPGTNGLTPIALARLSAPRARGPARRRLVTSAACRRSRAAPRRLPRTASPRRRRARPTRASVSTASGSSSSAAAVYDAAERGVPHGDRVLRANSRRRTASINNGPAYFVVEGLDGRIYEYGATADSSIDGRSTAPAGGARTWALNRMRDRSGNVIDYRYTEESGSTAFRIASIRYNANPSRGIAASHEIAFAYEDASEHGGRRRVSRRNARAPGRCGSRASTCSTAVKCCVATHSRTSPRFPPAGAAASPRSRNAARGGSDCLAPTTFSNGRTAKPACRAVAAFTASMPATTPYPVSVRWNLADIDGDGRNDYVFAGGTQMSSATIRYRLSRASGAFGPAVNTGIPCPTGIGVPFDANGDGRMDFLMGANGRWAIVRGSPAGLGAVGRTRESHFRRGRATSAAPTSTATASATSSGPRRPRTTRCASARSSPSRRADLALPSRSIRSGTPPDTTSRRAGTSSDIRAAASISTATATKSS